MLQISSWLYPVSSAVHQIDKQNILTIFSYEVLFSFFKGNPGEIFQWSVCKQALVFKTSFISALDPELTWYSSSFVFSICVLCRQGNLPTQEVFSPAGDNFTLGDIQWDDYPLVSGFPRRPGLCDPAVGVCKRVSAYIACISLLPDTFEPLGPLWAKMGEGPIQQEWRIPTDSIMSVAG